MSGTVEHDSRIERLCVEFLQRARGEQYFTGNRDYLIVHPELLSDGADRFLERNSADPHSSPAAYAFTRMRILFQRCREIGIDDAFEEESLKELTRAFLGNGDFGNKEDFVKQHPELLNPIADRVLADSASRQRSEGGRRIFESVRILLRRCNEIGITEAFREYRGEIPQHDASERALLKILQQFVVSNDNQERRTMLQQHPELLSPRADDLMKRAGDDPRVANKLQSVRQLLTLCREVGIDEAFREPPEIEQEIKKVHELAGQFLFADSPVEKKRLIEVYPQLLEPAAELILEQFASSLDDSAQNWVQKHRRLLGTCRESGVESAFARYSNSLEQNTGNLIDNQAEGIQDIVALSCEARARPELLPSLINACKSRLATLSKEARRREFVTLKMALGQAYSCLPSDSEGEPWKEAIRHLNEAIEACDPLDQPVIFANLNMEIARVWANLPVGDRYANQLRAQHHNGLALEAWKRDENIEQTVGTMLNIAHLFGEFVGGDEYINREAAVSYCKEALNMLQEAGKETNVALLSLGGALFYRKKGKREENRRAAVACLEDCLSRYGWNNAPANCLLNLGATLLESSCDLESANRARDYLVEAMARNKSDSNPVQFAAIQRGLARAYEVLGTDRHKEQIVAAYENSIRVLTLGNDPSGLLASLRGLGRFYCRRDEWRSASEILTRALDCSTEVYGWGLSRTTKLENIDEQAELFSLACYAAAKSGDVWRAIEILDRGKTRLLGENLRLHAARPENVPDDIWGEYLLASYIVRQNEWEESHGVMDYKQIDDTVRAREGRFADAVKAVTRHAGGFLKSSTVELIADRVLDISTSILTFCCTEFGSLAFVLFKGTPVDVQCVDIPNFTRQNLIDLITRKPNEEGYATEGWLGTLTPYLKSKTLASLSVWRNQIQSTLETLGKDLFSPALTAFPESIRSVVIVPSHEMYILPLQAISLVEGERRTLLDRYSVSFAPSMQILAHCSLHASGRRTTPFLAVTNPSEDETLAFAEDEGQIAAKCFEPAVIIHGRMAKRETIGRLLSEAGVAHFACHGVYRWEAPRKSGLVLADGELTVDDLLLGELTLAEEQADEGAKFLCLPVDLSGLRLVTLSACESGLSNILRGSPAEYLALSAGFLLAGVPSVISTLWAVNDVSTSLFMGRLYSHVAAGETTPQAVRSAALWLKNLTAAELADLCRRDALVRCTPLAIKSSLWRRFAAMNPRERPYEHPYYWAAFTSNGI